MTQFAVMYATHSSNFKRHLIFTIVVIDVLPQY